MIDFSKIIADDMAETMPYSTKDEMEQDFHAWQQAQMALLFEKIDAVYSKSSELPTRQQRRAFVRKQLKAL